MNRRFADNIIMSVIIGAIGLMSIILMPSLNVIAATVYDSIIIDEREYMPFAKDKIYTYMLPYEADADSVIEANKSRIDMKFMKGSQYIPALWLNMTDEDNEYIHDKKGNEAVISVDIFNTSDETERLTEAAAEVKGRGNVSWTRAKKSYQIKFIEKQNVLGMGKAKKWILLPASYDLSMVRNAVGFELSELLEMKYMCDYRYVDLYMGGRYYGVYILAEKPELKKNRIDIESVDDNIENVLGKDVMLSDVETVFNNNDYSTTIVNGQRIDLTGGYHLEFDNYSESKYQFKTEKGCRVTINEPEMISDGKDVKENDAYRYIIDFMQAVENAVYGYDDNELLRYIDIESFAKMWIIKDYMADGDANNNMHCRKESDITGDGLLHAGPTWDFDCTMDRDSSKVSSAKYQFVNMDSEGSGKWLGDLLNHKIFRDELLKQYEKYKELFTTVKIDGVETSPLREIVIKVSESYKDSSKMDTVRWAGTEDFCKKPTFNDNDRENSLNVVKEFILKRNEYLIGRMEKVRNMVSPVTPQKELPLPTVTPTVILTPGTNAIHQVTAQPLSQITLSDDNSDNEDNTYLETVIKKGDKIKDRKSGIIYVVRSIKKSKIELGVYKVFNKKVKLLTIPAKITLSDGKKAKVTSIMAKAFDKCNKLKKVVIGSNIRKIDKKALKRLKKIKNIKVKSRWVKKRL